MRTLKCRRCRCVFTVQGGLGQLCPNCIREEEEVYLKVRAFVKDNPGVSVQEVSDILSVSRARIMGYIKEERLEVTANSKAMLKCTNCGKPITTGVFCNECKRVHTTVNRVEKPDKQEPEKSPNLKSREGGSWHYTMGR